MSVVVELLFWIHLVSLALGGVAVYGIPIVGSKMRSATPEQRPLLIKITHQLSTVGRGAFLALIITGPLMLWLGFGGTAPNMVWFWIKMLFVLIVLGVIIAGGINGSRAEKGDMAAARRAPLIGMTGMAAFTLLIFCAVFAFS